MKPPVMALALALTLTLAGLLAEPAAAGATTSAAADSATPPSPATPAAPSQKISVPLSDPARPAVIKVHTITGGITVEGYGGREVTVETVGRSAAAEEPEAPDHEHAGMRRMPRTTGLTADEDHNVVEIEAQPWRGGSGLRLQVPVHSSLHLSCVNGCDIRVTGVEGELELHSINGSIEATDVAGSVVANTTNGSVKVALKRVDAGKPMAFSTLNGNVDVTFPPDIKALLRLRSGRGDVYSDFDLDTQGHLVSRVTTKEGRHRIEAESEIQGTVGGGGPEILVKTFNGDILIHRARS
jgi:hypothetical protein